MKAYVYRSGEIGFGDLIPQGALYIATGEPEKLRATVSGLARRTYDNETLLVPGIPEAQDNTALALQALAAFMAHVYAGLKK